MVHLHWPHWASEVVSDAEHQGEFEMLSFVFALSIMIAAFLFAVSLVLEAFLRFN